MIGRTADRGSLPGVSVSACVLSKTAGAACQARGLIPFRGLHRRVRLMSVAAGFPAEVDRFVPSNPGCGSFRGSGAGLASAVFRCRAYSGIGHREGGMCSWWGNGVFDGPGFLAVGKERAPWIERQKQSSRPRSGRCFSLRRPEGFGTAEASPRSQAGRRQGPGREEPSRQDRSRRQGSCWNRAPA